MATKKQVKKVVKKGREKVRPVDGLGPYEKKKLRNAVRQVWHRSLARKLCVKRATGADGFEVCEKCKKKTPRNKIDHITNVGEVDSGFIDRMFVPSKYLQALCVQCHNAKTKLERQILKRKRDDEKGFY